MKRHAFTLIELLAVIAIIGILAGITIPATGKARARAKGVACLNNYKQLGTACLTYRADHNGKMPMATANHQVPENPRGKTFNVTPADGQVIGIIDYLYLHSFIITDGPDTDGVCQISGATKNNGDIWLCPTTLDSLKKLGGKEARRAGFFLAVANRGIDKTQFNYNIFGTSSETSIPTNAPVSLDLIPMMAELCSNSCVTGSVGDPQKGYRADPKKRIPPPHSDMYVVNFVDGHAEFYPADKTDRYLNWQPVNDHDKYYKPYGDRALP